jgi:hypothetical protein
MPDVLDDDGVRTPVDEMPEGFVCEVCEKSYKTKAALGGHRWGVHKLRKGEMFSTAASDTTKAPPKQDEPPKPPPGQDKPLSMRLEGSFGFIGLGVTFIDPYDGRCVTAGSHNLAVALGQVAEQYPEAGKYIEMLCIDGPWIAILVATAPILLPILVHHGLIPPILPAPFAGPADPHRRGAKGKWAKAYSDAAGSTGEGDVSRETSTPSNPLLDLLGGIMSQAASAGARPMGEGAPDVVATGPAGGVVIDVVDLDRHLVEQIE